MRKEITIKITDDKLAGRDVGKEFVITEMSAFQTEMWSFRALQLLSKEKLQINDFLNEDGGVSLNALKLFQVGLSSISQCNPLEVKELFDEMMECIKIKMPGGGTRNIIDGSDDIEEIYTIYKLRQAWFNLNFSFFKAFNS